jgi:death-on-curing protein
VSTPAGIPIDFPTILDVTADSGVDDFGVPWAAAARIAARLIDQDVYHGTFVKAAALLDLLLRHPWLEARQARACWAAAGALLAVNGYRLREDVKNGELAALTSRIAGPGVPLQELARVLRDWSEEQEPGS